VLRWFVAGRSDPDRGGQHLGGGLEEGDVVPREPPWSRSIDTEDAKGAEPAGNDDDHAARDAVLLEEMRGDESAMRPDVIDNHGNARVERRPGRGALPGFDGCTAHGSCSPAHTGAEKQCVPLGKQLEQAAVVCAQQPGGHLGDFLQERSRLTILLKEPAKLGNRSRSSAAVSPHVLKRARHGSTSMPL
jgi:hypothetical protein